MKNTNYISKNQKGFSLIELMIALIIGLILTGGAIQIFISSKATYKSGNALSRLQENGRFIIDYMASDLRMTGYMGCSSRTPVITTILANDPPNPAFDINNSIIGYDNGVGWTNPISASITRWPGTDVIIIRRVAANAPRLEEEVADNANIKINTNPTNIQADEIVIITDCVNADMIRTTTVSNPPPGTPVNIAHSNSANDFAGAGLANNKLSKIYGPDTILLAFQQSTYFIGDDGSGTPGLYIIPFEGVAGEEILLAKDVEDIQIFYGEDTGGGDDYADVYVSASNVTDWANVRSIRVILLLMSEDRVTEEPRVVTFTNDTGTATVTVNNGDSTPAYDTAIDNRLRMIFTSTVAIRNRLP